MAASAPQQQNRSAVPAQLASSPAQGSSSPPQSLSWSQRDFLAGRAKVVFGPPLHDLVSRHILSGSSLPQALTTVECGAMHQIAIAIRTPSSVLIDAIDTLGVDLAALHRLHIGDRRIVDSRIPPILGSALAARAADVGYEQVCGELDQVEASLRVPTGVHRPPAPVLRDAPEFVLRLGLPRANAHL